MGKKNKSSSTSGGDGGGGGDDAKHEAKLQAVILADPFDGSDGTTTSTVTFRPLNFEKRSKSAPILCPLNNVVLLDYTLDFCAGVGVEEVIVVCVQEEVEQHVQQKWQSQSQQQSTTTTNGNSNNNMMMSVTTLRDGSLTNAGDALRELDKRNLVQSDPFLLLRGDVITNVDLQSVLKEHKERHKADSSAIMTLLFKPVSCWNVEEVENDGDVVTDDDYVKVDNNKNNSNKQQQPKATYSSLRASTEDLVVGLDTNTHNVPGNAPRIYVYDDKPSNGHVHLPCSFLTACPQVDFRYDLLDCGIDICSPDVLARFSDEFDYRDIRKEFVANSVAEEEEGLQSKLYAHILPPSSYAARVQDWKTYAAISHDLLQRWCYPIVPENLPSGYEKQYKYVRQTSAAARRTTGSTHNNVYREQKSLSSTKVGRSSVVTGSGMIGSHCIIGENCSITNTVIGNHCRIGDNVTLVDCHIWDDVTIEDGASVKQSILSYDCIIKSGAKVSKGCIVGEGCIIGSNMKLPTFSRITTVSKEDEEDSDDDFDDFDDDDDDDDDEEEEEEADAAASPPATTSAKAPTGEGSGEEDEVETDHAIVGKDGRGRMWLPSIDDDDDDSDEDDEDDDEADQKALLAKLNEMKSRSIGFDPTNLYLERKKKHEADQEDDGFSDDDNDAMDGGMGGGVDEEDELFGGPTATNEGGGGGGGSEGGGKIIGRQAGVDVVKELKTICLEFEPTSPMENLAIELNSYKFSQNATYSDCAMGATLAVLDLMKITKTMSDGKLIGALKSQLETWTPLFKRLCIGVEEEKAVIVALENAAIGGGEISDKLSTGPSFRFMLQTLHDEEVISEECVLTWASERRTDANTQADEGVDNPRITLFELQPVQDFLEWLEGDSSEEDGSEEEESEEE